MRHDSSDDDFLQPILQDWVAGYPPWFSNHWLEPARCRTKEEASQLLHLLRSIEDGQPEETRRLLPGINPNLRLPAGEGTESLLEWAAEKAGHLECIRLLVSAGADVKAPSLVYKLVTYGKSEVIAELLQAGADPNTGPKGETPLTAACWGDAKAVRLLLAAGARTDIATAVYITNAKQVKKVSPLMIAAYAGQLQIVKLLLAARADINAVDAAGNTALDWVRVSRAKGKAAKIIPLLEQAGASAQQPGKLAQPVDFASRAKTYEFQKAIERVKALTRSSAKPVLLEEGPLHGAWAFRIRSPESAISLLDEIRPQVLALGALAFLSEGLHEMSAIYLVMLPTTDYREAIIAFETPVGQSIDSYDLVAWLGKLEELQPFVITHLAPDLIRARFTTPLKDPIALARSIEAICADVGDASLSDLARQLESSRELFLWWG